MFDQLVPWNILPEREVYIGNHELVDKLVDKSKAQRAHIAELKEIDERNRQQYEQLVNWTRELEVRNEALYEGFKEYLHEKNIYEEDKDLATMLIRKHKEKAYDKKEKEGVIIERDNFFI